MFKNPNPDTIQLHTQNDVTFLNDFNSLIKKKTLGSYEVYFSSQIAEIFERKEQFEKDSSLTNFMQMSDVISSTIKSLRSLKSKIRYNKNSLDKINTDRKNYKYDVAYAFFSGYATTKKRYEIENDWTRKNFDATVVDYLYSILIGGYINLIQLFCYFESLQILTSGVTEQFLSSPEKYLAYVYAGTDKQSSLEILEPLLKKTLKKAGNPSIKSAIQKKNIGFSNKNHQEIRNTFPKAKKQTIRPSDHIDDFWNVILDSIDLEGCAQGSVNMREIIFKFTPIVSRLIKNNGEKLIQLFDQYLFTVFFLAYQDSHNKQSANAVKDTHQDQKKQNTLQSTNTFNQNLQDSISTMLGNQVVNEQLPVGVINYITKISEYTLPTLRRDLKRYLRRMYIKKQGVRRDRMITYYSLKCTDDLKKKLRKDAASHGFVFSSGLSSFSEKKGTKRKKDTGKKLMEGGDDENLSDTDLDPKLFESYEDLFTNIDGKKKLDQAKIFAHYESFGFHIQQSPKEFEKYLHQIESSGSTSTNSAAIGMYNSALPKNRREPTRKTRVGLYVLRVGLYRITRDNDVIIDLLPHDIYQKKYYKSNDNKKGKFVK